MGQIALSYGMISTPSNHGFLGPPESSNRRLDRFSLFCMAHERDQQTHRPRYSVCSNGAHLMH